MAGRRSAREDRLFQRTAISVAVRPPKAYLSGNVENG